MTRKFTTLSAIVKCLFEEKPERPANARKCPQKAQNAGNISFPIPRCSARHNRKIVASARPDFLLTPGRCATGLAVVVSVRSAFRIPLPCGRGSEQAVCRYPVTAVLCVLCILCVLCVKIRCRCRSFRIPPWNRSPLASPAPNHYDMPMVMGAQTEMRMLSAEFSALRGGGGGGGGGVRTECF